MTDTVQSIERYRAGTNEILDRLYDELADGPLWIVQGSTGRRPVLAPSEAQAVAKYKAQANE